MVKVVQQVRHTTAAADAYTGSVGQVTQVTTTDELRSHDGSTAGGKRILTKTMNDALYQSLSTLLTAMGAVSATDGMVAKTGAATVAARTNTGTSNQIDVDNGGGAAGNPTFSISATLVIPGTMDTTAGILTGAAATFSTMGLSGTLTAVAANFSGAVGFADNTVGRALLVDTGYKGRTVGATGATETLDHAAELAFSATVDEACTFTFSNFPASPNEGGFTLYLTNGGAFTVTWPSSVDWAGGAAPTLTASGVDVLCFTSIDGGTIINGFVAGLAMA